MPSRHIRVLHTGGTLGMVEGPQGLQPVPGMLERELRSSPRFHVQGSAALTLPVDDPALTVTYDVVEFDPLLDSSNMRMEDWALVARAIADAHDDADAFVVIHGTDTMAYATAALSFMLDHLRKSVIFTGSQIPFAHVRNDAHDNLQGALWLAAHYDIPEVSLYFHNKLLRGNRITKVDAEGLDAFRSPNLRPLAHIGTHVAVDWDLVRAPSSRPLCVRPMCDPGVASVQLFPGMTNETLERLLQPPLKGAVIQTYGTGNAPHRDAGFLGVIERATNAGLLLLNVSQCVRGRVHSHYAAGRALSDLGVVSGQDMTAEAALCKLAWVLSQPDLTHDEARAALERDLRGELTLAEVTPRFGVNRSPIDVTEALDVPAPQGSGREPQTGP